MAGDRYLTLLPPNFSQQALIPASQTSAGAPNAGDLIAARDDGFLDPSWLPAGVGETVVSKVAFENIAAGRLVQERADGTVQLADNSNGRQADGFVLTAVTAGNSVNVYFSGIVTGLTGLTDAAKLFLGTSGQITSTAPTAAGTTWQPVGKAIGTTQAMFFRGEPIAIQ